VRADHCRRNRFQSGATHLQKQATWVVRAGCVAIRKLYGLCSDALHLASRPNAIDLARGLCLALRVATCHAVTYMLEAAEYFCNVPALEEAGQVTLYETIGANVCGEQLAKRQEI